MERRIHGFGLVWSVFFINIIKMKRGLQYGLLLLYIHTYTLFNVVQFLILCRKNVSAELRRRRRRSSRVSSMWVNGR